MEAQADHRGDGPARTTSGSPPASATLDPGPARRAAGPVRGPGARRDRAGLVHAVHRAAPRLPRPAGRDHRRRAQHDHRQPADRGAARPSRSGSPPSCRSIRTSCSAAGGAAAPNAELEEKAALLSEQNRNIEIKNLEIEQARRRWRSGPAARAGLPVQVGVPGEHVPRAAHAAELAADAGPAARRQPGRQPHRQADRVRQHHPQRRLGPAPADQRHPGPVQDRGRPDGRRRRADLASPSCVDYVEADVPPAGRRTRGWTSRSSRRRTLPRRSVTDEQRLQQMLRNLLSNAVKFTEHGRGRRCASIRAQARGARAAPCDGADGVVAFAVADTGIGIAAEQAGADLRGVPAGRRHDQPQVRRHRPRACRSAGSSPACSAARST